MNDESNTIASDKNALSTGYNPLSLEHGERRFSAANPRKLQSQETIDARVKFLGYTVEEAMRRRPSLTRPTNDEFFMLIAGVVSRRSTCARRAVGAVLVDVHKNILSTGYNSVASGLPHCHEVNCKGAQEQSGQNLHLCEARHAEDIALMKCSNIYAVDTVYTTTEPCVHCTRRLLDTSARRIVFAESYPTTSSKIWTDTGRIWEQLK